MKNTIILIVFILSITLFFFGCDEKKESKILDTTITKTNLPEMINNLKTENILEAGDIVIINSALNRLGANNPDTLYGMSLRNIYDLQKEYLKEQNYDLLSKSATRISMNMNYEIKYLGIKPVVDTVNKIKGNSVMYEFSNNTDNAIKKIQGLLQFYNSQNNLIKQFEIDNTEQIPPKDTVRFYKAFAHNDNEPRDSIIRYHNDKLIVRWKPFYLEFDDGTKIELKK
jgi:hypothetical protein